MSDAWESVVFPTGFGYVVSSSYKEWKQVAGQLHSLSLLCCDLDAPELVRLELRDLRSSPLSHS
eukprot:5056283-Amphidinium_carterae.1